MREPRFCPHCGIDLYGEVVPGMVDDDGKEQRFYRALAVEIWGVYDGVLFYACPDCHHTWHWWTARYDALRWAAAEKYRARFTDDLTTKDKQCSE